jgi:hypothetical protein
MLIWINYYDFVRISLYTLLNSTATKKIRSFPGTVKDTAQGTEGEKENVG